MECLTRKQAGAYCHTLWKDAVCDCKDNIFTVKRHTLLVLTRQEGGKSLEGTCESETEELKEDLKDELAKNGKVSEELFRVFRN